MSAWLDDRAAAKRADRPWAAAVNTTRLADLLRTEGATAADDAAYAEWLPLLERAKSPAYVTAAIPERFRARYETECRTS